MPGAVYCRPQRDVLPAARVDADHFALVDEERHPHHRTRLKLCRLLPAGGGVAVQSRIGLDDLQLDVRRGRDEQGPSNGGEEPSAGWSTCSFPCSFPVGRTAKMALSQKNGAISVRCPRLASGRQPMRRQKPCKFPCLAGSFAETGSLWTQPTANYPSQIVSDRLKNRKNAEKPRYAHPELKSTFLSARAAEEFAAKRISDPGDRERFLELVRAAICPCSVIASPIDRRNTPVASLSAESLPRFRPDPTNCQQ
jgi:hypothetical protein